VLVTTSTRAALALPKPPVVGERNVKNLRNILMPTKLPSKVTPGCFKCQAKCILCQNHLIENNTFTSDVTGELFSLKQRLTCESTRVVYLLHCDLCPKAQYVGQTTNTLKTRFYGHRAHIKRNAGTLVTNHFNLPGHSLTNMKCIAVEGVYTPGQRALDNREQFWMQKLKTITPDGLNIRN